VQPTIYAPLAVKNLSPKRGIAGITIVSDMDYLGASWFYDWSHSWDDGYTGCAPMMRSDSRCRMRGFCGDC
jgi:hypothetical protein